MSLLDKINKSQGNKLNVPVLSPTQTKVSEFAFRVLPYKHQEGLDPFIIVEMHNNIGKEKKGFALCPEKTFGRPCPYCEAGRLIKDKLSKEDWKEVAKLYYTQSTVYIPGIVRGVSPQFSFLKVSHFNNFQKQIIGILTSKQLKELFNMPEDKEFIEIWDLKTGIDFIVKKLEKSAQSAYEQFSIEAGLKQKPAITTALEKELIINYMNNTPDLVAEIERAYGSDAKIAESFKQQFPNTVAKNEQKIAVSSALNSEIPSSNVAEANKSLEMPILDDLGEFDSSLSESTLETPSESAPVVVSDDDYDKIMAEMTSLK